MGQTCIITFLFLPSLSPHLPKLHHIQHRKHHSIHSTMPTLMKMPVEPMRQGVGIVAQALEEGIHSGTFGTHIMRR